MLSADGLAGAGVDDAPATASSLLSEPVRGEILLKLRQPLTFQNGDLIAGAGAMGGLGAPLGAALGSTLAGLGATNIEQTLAESPAPFLGPLTISEYARVTAREDLSHWYQVTLPAGADAAAALATLTSLPEVEAAEPVVDWSLAAEIPRVIEGLPDGTTDPGYTQQWFHRNAKIPNAWDYLNTNGVYPGGKHDVVVAVIDTGVDYNHPELAGNIWVNADEIPGNGLDDDGNGFVDDVHGCSVVADGRSHSGDPIDLHGHGTHVAGIIAGQAFNDQGGIGVAFNVQIMPIRAAQYSGTLTNQDIAEAVLYAIDNGAEVINMSFGGYQRSQIIEDALEMALNQAVLVAAAGNDGLDSSVAPSYPAALPYVLGVQASGIDNRRAWFSNYGSAYEITAPGESIYSTLPNNQYAAWSGTSMATPVVSGVAALMRSHFWQRDIYSSRFIMGSIAASGGVVDAYRALTEPPKPGVTLYDNWLFDDPEIDPANDGDGRADAGETVHVGIELINRSGQADHVIAILEAYAPGAVLPDPYVDIVSNTVALRGIGPFALADNGLIWDDGGVIVGVEDPFVFEVSPDCPNDHVIPFVVTVYFEDGWDPERPMMMSVSRFEYIVQRGRNVPTVVSENLTLTADDYWIVGGPVLVEPQATLTIAAGAQVQWGAISSDPYNPGPQTGSLLVRGGLVVAGTGEQPAALFPSYLVSGQRVNITVESSGTADIQYASVRNANITGFRNLDHVYFDWDAYATVIGAKYASNSIFHKLRGSSTSLSISRYENCLFDAGWFGPGGSKVSDSVFLQDNENNKFLSLAPSISLYNPFQGAALGLLAPRYEEGYTYATLPMDNCSLRVAELAASFYGGHVASVRSAEEEASLEAYVFWALNNGANVRSSGNTFFIGLTDEGHLGTYNWLDGSPVTYTNWLAGQPVPLNPASEHLVAIVKTEYGQPSTVGWQAMTPPAATRFQFVVRIPGEWTAAQLNAPVSDGSVQAHLRDNLRVYEDGNALLSKYWDPALSHWMRVVAPTGANYYSILRDNFWGTESTTIIDYAIVDYYDNFTTTRVEYQPFLSHGAESTYPFVERVLVNGVLADTVPEVGAGPAEFTVSFNRDMDPAVQPFVTFGPSTPHTDFTVRPSGTQQAEFVVRLSGPADRPLTVDYATKEATALAEVDFRATSGTLTFEPGETEKTVRVPLLGDWQPESDKRFALVLSRPTVAALANDEATADIRDDDVQVSIADAVLREGDSGSVDAVFTVSLSRPAIQDFTVRYETADGTARAGQDYQKKAGTLTFVAGQTEQAIRVAVTGDLVHEPDEDFFVTLFQSTSAEIVGGTAQGTIWDNDPLLTVDDAEVVEGDSGTVELTFTVRLSQSPGKTIHVDYATADGTALAGQDYLAASGTLTFTDGSPATQTVTVQVLGDTTTEFAETLFLNLSNVVGTQLGDSRAEGTILPDDGTSVSINDLQVVETDGPPAPWGRYLGGDVTESAYDVALDSQGNLWVVGYSDSANFPIVGSGSTSRGGIDGFVAKFAPDGELLWSTFLGGTGTDQASQVAVDASGSVWVAGYTTSSGWITGGGDTSFGGGTDAFVAKFQADGQLLWSSYLGGSNNDRAFGIGVDGAGNGYVSGYTESSGWVSGGGDTSYGGTRDGFLTRFGPDGQIAWSTYLGGTAADEANAVAVDPQGNPWTVGWTSSPSWTTSGSYVGSQDAFVARIGADGQTLWSTYVGGTNTDVLYDVAFDSFGEAWVVGAIAYDSYVNKLALDGTSLWSRTTDVAGGGSWDWAYSVTVDAAGDIWTTGGTYEAAEGYVKKIHAGGQTLWSQDVGGTGVGTPSAIAVDQWGHGWVVGQTSCAGWMTGGPDTTLTGTGDAFLVRVTDVGTIDAEFTVTLSQAPTSRVTVDFTTLRAGAEADRDYRAVSGSLSFAPGHPLTRTISVPILGDDKPEADELFSVLLSSTTVPLADCRGVATILDDDPLLSVDSVSIIEGTGGTIEAVLTISISMDPRAAVTVSYATADDTATAGSDYQAAGGTLTFSPGGAREQTIVIRVNPDDVDELDETFTVLLSGVAGAAIAVARGEVTIVDDDVPSLSIGDAAVVEGDEGASQAVFTVSLSAAPVEATTVFYRTLDGTAVAGADYRITTGKLLFSPGGPISQTVLVPVWGDTAPEPDESFVLELYDADHAELGDPQGEGVIRDDDLAISIGDAMVPEGDSGTTEMVFSVHLSAISSYPVSVEYATADGTAASGSDYFAQSGSLTFAPGQIEQTVSITISGDTQTETNETFFVNLDAASGAAIKDGQGVGTIVGDDGPLLSIADSQLVEGDSGTRYMQYTVSLSADPGQTVQVSYATSDGTARAGSDYNSAAGTLFFPSGTLQATFLVPVLGDTFHEPDESILVTLFGATLVGIGDWQAVGTIQDDDPLLWVADASLAEGLSGNPAMLFTVGVSQVPPENVTVHFATADGSATAGADYLAASGDLTFGPGLPTEQTVTVYLISDGWNEAHETFRLVLSDAAWAEIAPEGGTGTILDDDGPKLSIGDVTIVEGDSGTRTLVFSVALSQPAAESVSVNFASADGTARRGVDYQSTTGTVTFEVGQTSRTIQVPVYGDMTDELDETVLVRLSGATGGIPILNAEATGTIQDDDTALIAVDDLEVNEGFDGWVNARTWIGSYWVTPMTGESYHLMRISGAVAADDSWLVSGYDVGRFRFQVKTMGVFAMTLQATGVEGAIRLSWQQDDFDLLAGYHVYRSTSPNGTYTRISATVIPVGQEWFVDTNVQPAVPMYYKFTVVETDMSESGFSNVASAAAIDTVAPVITHAPKTTAVPGSGLRLTADVTDNVSVAEVAIHYRAAGSSNPFTTQAMANLSGSSYSGTIPGSAVLPPGLEYYLTASDGINTVYRGTPGAPYLVLVSDQPAVTVVSPGEGAYQGGTTVTLSGSLLQPGLHVYFDGQPASNVVWLTENQITCTTPPHFPAMVDVTVVNPGGSSATLLNGFRYVDQDIVLALPEASGDCGTFVVLPVSVSNVHGLRAANVVVTFNSSVVLARAVTTGNLTSGWTLASNLATAGSVVISLANASAVDGTGVLANIRFEVVGTASAQTALAFDAGRTSLNDGAIDYDVQPGQFTVNGLFTISGKISYFTGARAVPDVGLLLAGGAPHSAISDSAGNYSIADVLTGAYTLTPAKSDGAAEITAYDASLVLQNAAGLITLTASQTVAADVTRNSHVTAMDASYILEAAVGLRAPPFPGAGRVWDFSPQERTYSALNANQANQNFTAILLGDVSGNWMPPSPPGAPAMTAGANTSTAALIVPVVESSSGQVAHVPLRIELAGAEVHAADLVIHYDPASLAITADGVLLGPSAVGMSKAVNASQPGVLCVGLASAYPIAADGELLDLTFQVIGDLEAFSPLVVESARLDEDMIQVACQNGGVQDTISPQVTAADVTSWGARPALSGTVDDPTARVEVVIGGTSYVAANGQDGTWSIAAGSIDPLPGDGRYSLSATATDRAGNSSLASATVVVNLSNLDADGNGAADALSDGLLILRYLFDPHGPWSVSDAVGDGAARTAREVIKSYLDDGDATALDADGNGAADPLSDGILILRYLFDREGQWNVADAVNSGATRTTREEIRAYLDQYNPLYTALDALAPNAAPLAAANDSATGASVQAPNPLESGVWAAALRPEVRQDAPAGLGTTPGEQQELLASLAPLDAVLESWAEAQSADSLAVQGSARSVSSATHEETDATDALIGRGEFGELLQGGLSDEPLG